MARDELSELLLELKKDILRAVDNKVDKEVREVYKEEVEYMYSEFTPNYYQRRYDNNGFADESNWDSDVKLSNSEIEYSLINETETYNSSPYRLDEIIEEGVGYNWNRKPEARPVYQRTQDRIDTEDVVENALEYELKKRGYELK